MTNQTMDIWLVQAKNVFRKPKGLYFNIDIINK